MGTQFSDPPVTEEVGAKGVGFVDGYSANGESSWERRNRSLRTARRDSNRSRNENRDEDNDDDKNCNYTANIDLIYDNEKERYNQPK